MAEADDNNNNNDEEHMESHPFFVQAEFPFVFIPTTGFTFTNDQIDDDVVVDNQTATDDKEEEEGENEETIDDEVEPTEENNDLRISQPKYSQLLKDLDFSQARMVDVTNLLVDEITTSNENESIPKVNSVDDQSQNLPSTSTDDDDNQEALSDAANEVQNDLNNLADVLLQASQMPTDVNRIHDTQKTKSTEEDDDTSKQATQNYDLHDNEQPEMTSTTKNNNNNKSLRFSADTENLSSIPRLNPANQDEQVITWDELLNGAAADQQPATQVTPVKVSSPKQKHSQRTRSTSSSSDDYSSRKSQSIDEDKSCTTASDILIRRLSNDNLKKPQTQSKETNDTWLSMLDKLEREHKKRLEKQQQQYEEYMQTLEEKMKQRLDDYLNSTNSLNDSKTDAFTTRPSAYHHYRPLAKDVDKQRPTTFNSSLSRSQSREDISTLRTELTAKHAKHISDLKSYYEDEIEELKKQLNRPRMGSQPSSSTRQSIETIERINNENIRLHDEIKELRRSFKLAEDENRTLKRQIDELKDQINRKDIDLKNYYRKLTDIEQQFNAVQATKERQDEKFRHADRQAILYREENEKLTGELNLTRERLLRLEERYRELETENKTHRSQIFNSNNPERLTDEMKLNSTMALNMPTSREYGRFTLTTSKYSSTSSPRDTNYGADDLFQQNTSPRPLTKITEYINERPSFPQAYVPPSSRATQSRLDFIDNHIKQSEQLEEKFDDLLKKKRDLESRINRIPTRGLTSTDRQLLEVLEREMERVDHQISSVKLELRKMNILRTTH